MKLFTILSLSMVFNYTGAIINSKPLAYSLDTQGPLNIVINLSFGTRSHVKSLFEIAAKLVERGHNVTYTSLDDTLEYVNGYNISSVSLGSSLVDPKIARSLMKNVIDNPEPKNTIQMMSELLGSRLLASYKNSFKPLESYLIETQPNLLICDFFSIPCIDLAKKLGIPLITGFQTSDFIEINPKSYITKSFLEHGPIYTKELSFIEKFNQLVITPLASSKYIYKLINSFDEVREQFGIPRTNSILGDVNYGLKIANTFTGFEPALPSDPNLIEVGPILSLNTQKFDKELENYFNKHKRTLYIGFGSKSVLNSKLSSKLLEGAVKAIDLNIIDSVVWGLGSTKQEDFPTQITTPSGEVLDTSTFFNNQHPHIKLLKWAPQVNILNHPSTKLFISHGGLQSTFEALYSGTPIICLALFGDQPRNARKLEDTNTGLFLDKKTFTSDILVDKIRDIIEDKDNKYIAGITKMKTIASHSSKRIKYAADIFEQHAYTAKSCRQYQPFDPASGLPPCEVQHLIPADHDMNIITANGIDVYGFALLAVLLGVGITGLLLARLVFYLKNLNHSKPKTQ